MFKYTAVMVEPREHKAIHFVLNNFLTNLSDDWEIRILVGDDNINYVTNIVKQLCKSDRLKVINIGIKNMINGEYNKLLMTKSFYDNIPTDMFLIFQTDSMIFSKYKEFINIFMDYDYVGAPWTSGHVGNGGLSLRRKSIMLQIIDRGVTLLHNEDVYFSLLYQINKPQFELAKFFSIETVFNESSFGIHNAWKYLSHDQVEFLKEKYEGLSELIQLNSSFN